MAKWTLTQQRSDGNGYPVTERDRMMEYPGVTRRGTCGASSFGADEWLENGPSRDGPEQWPEWKQENDRAYQQYFDEVFKGDLD